MFYTTNDVFKTFVVGREYKFAFLPKKCHKTKTLIWLKYGYKITAMYTGPGDPVFDYRWYKKDEYLIAKLKGEI